MPARRESKHPQYEAALADWTRLDHVLEGETAVKLQTTLYLPATEGQRALGMGKKTDEGQEG